MGEPGRRTRGKKTVGLDGDDDDVVTHIYDNDNIFSLYLPQLANKSQLFFVLRLLTLQDVVYKVYTFVYKKPHGRIFYQKKKNFTF